MKGQLLKSKSIDDDAREISEDPQPGAKETDEELAGDITPVKISLNVESGKDWEESCSRLRDMFK